MTCFWAGIRYRGQARWMKPKTIPRKHQDKYMTQMDDVANWAISTEVRTFYEKARAEFQRLDRCKTKKR
jgi:hypothetical protein